MQSSKQLISTNGETHVTPALLFQIEGSAVNGPLNLAETALSGQTAEPEWRKNNASFTDVEVLRGIPVKYTMTQVGDADNFTLKVQAITSRPDEADEVDLMEHVFHTLGLGDDLPFFYRKFSEEDETLSGTFRNFRGLRLMRGTDLFQSLISSILSQNNSVRLWNRSARLMMTNFGRRVSFPDGSVECLFPSAETLARTNPRTLKARTRIGYRAKPVVMVSRMVANGELNLRKITEQSYEKALDSLLQLPGVGPKVADCFLLYGAGQMEAAPVDVWIHRIVTKLYFGGRKASKLRTSRFLRERFRKWAGYAQLYLFDYARRGAV